MRGGIESLILPLPLLLLQELTAPSITKLKRREKRKTFSRARGLEGHIVTIRKVHTLVLLLARWRVTDSHNSKL
jgi:hypothetical protein